MIAHLPGNVKSVLKNREERAEKNRRLHRRKGGGRNGPGGERPGASGRNKKDCSGVGLQALHLGPPLGEGEDQREEQGEGGHADAVPKFVLCSQIFFAFHV